MSENVQTAELLSAWLCDDVRPEERVAIEQLLAANPEFKAQADELRRLTALLKKGELPVKPALLDALKQRLETAVAERISAGEVEALVAANLSNDVSAREKQILDKHLKLHPAAKSEADSLKNLNELLKKNERSLSADASAKLIERLNAKLPPAAKIAPATPTSTTMPAVQSSKRTVASVRVFAAPENLWPRRIAYGVAAAAVFALVVGLSKFIGKGGSTGTEIVNTGTDTKPKDQNPSPEVVKNENQQRIPDYRPEQKIVERNQTPQVPPAPREGVELPPPAPVENIVVKDPPKNVPQVPEQFTPTQTPKNQAVAEKPKNAPNETQRPDNQVAKNDTEKNRTIPAPAPRLPDTFVGDNAPLIVDNPGVGTIGVGNVGTIAQNTNNQAGNSAVKAVNSEKNVYAPVAGMGVVGAVRGTAQARKPNGENVTLTLGSQVPSNSDLITDESRVGLILPGDGRLYVNTKTRLTLTFEGMNTTIVLQSGEISYRAPAAGSLTLSAGAVSVTRGKSLDAKIDNASLVVHVFDQSVQISTKTKRVQVQAGSTGIVALSGAEAPKKEATDGQPDSWTGVLVFPGEGTTANPKNITSDGKGRSRSSR